MSDVFSVSILVLGTSMRCFDMRRCEVCVLAAFSHGAESMVVQ